MKILLAMILTCLTTIVNAAAGPTNENNFYFQGAATGVEVGQEEMGLMSCSVGSKAPPVLYCVGMLQDMSTIGIYINKDRRIFAYEIISVPEMAVKVYAYMEHVNEAPCDKTKVCQMVVGDDMVAISLIDEMPGYANIKVYNKSISPVE